MATLGGVATPLVRRETPLPARREQQFSTTSDNQNGVSIQVYIGESPLVGKNIQIGQIELKGLPDAPLGEPQVGVVFEVTQACEVTVTATEKKTKLVVTGKLEVPPEHLNTEHVAAVLSRANESRHEDQQKLEAIEGINGANSVLHRAEKYLQDQQPYGLGDSPRRKLEEMIAALGLSLQQEDIAAVRTNSNQLQQLLSEAAFWPLFGGGPDMFSGMVAGLSTRSQSRSQAKSTARAGQDNSSSETSKPKQSEEVAQSNKELFAAGHHFEAKRLVRDLFAQAGRSIVIIDGYVGEDVLNLLTVKGQAVHVRLLTGKLSPAFLTLARDFARQYKGLEIRSSKVFHDRFIILDDSHCYHFGASLEHLGNKTFMFSKIEEPWMQSALLKQCGQAWDHADHIL
jgi:hypothetical protein